MTIFSIGTKIYLNIDRKIRNNFPIDLSILITYKKTIIAKIGLLPIKTLSLYIQFTDESFLNTIKIFYSNFCYKIMIKSELNSCKIIFHEKRGQII
jgi:hypothetical protein